MPERKDLDIVGKLRRIATVADQPDSTPFLVERANLAKEAADEIEQLRRIRELCIKALVIATGATREEIEAAPFEHAYRAAKEIERLRKEVHALRKEIQNA